MEHHLLLCTIGKPDIPGLDDTFQTVQPHIELQDRKSRRYRLKCIYSRTLLGRAEAKHADVGADIQDDVFSPA